MDAMRPATASEVAATLSDSTIEEARLLVDRYSEDPRKQVQRAVASARRRIAHEDAERERVLAMYDLEREVGGDGLVIGVDEVGRGALAGPLTVAAVALPADPVAWGINDSKQLSPTKRSLLARQISEIAVAIGISHVSPGHIDKIGMAAALREAMSSAIRDAGVEPDRVLIDGNPVHAHPRELCLVKGDARVASIAAASIVAKVTRDSLMVAYEEEYPGYHLAECKGYGSPEHIAAIRAKGLTPIHRISFCGNFLETPRLF